MHKLTREHAVIIDSYVARELTLEMNFDDEESKQTQIQILSYLETRQPNELPENLRIVFNPTEVMTKLFSLRRDLPTASNREARKIFKKTASLIAHISLFHGMWEYARQEIEKKGENTDVARKTCNQCQTKLVQLILEPSFNDIFQQSATDTQIFLVQKIRNLKNAGIWQDKTVEYTEMQKNLIIVTKKWVEVQYNTQRHTIWQKQAIILSTANLWSQLQEVLNLNDLIWLKKQIDHANSNVIARTSARMSHNMVSNIVSMLSGMLCLALLMWTWKEKEWYRWHRFRKFFDQAIGIHRCLLYSSENGESAADCYENYTPMYEPREAREATPVDVALNYNVDQYEPQFFLGTSFGIAICCCFFLLMPWLNRRAVLFLQDNNLHEVPQLSLVKVEYPTWIKELEAKLQSNENSNSSSTHALNLIQ